MRGLILLGLLLSALAQAAKDDIAQAQLAEKQRQQAVQHIRGNFDQWLASPDAFAKRVRKECAAFPEGRSYPFLIPALAYTNLGLRGDMEADAAAAKVRTLIELAIPSTADFVDAPDGDLMQMRSYGKHGTFLSTLNLALGNYAMLVEESEFQALHDHLSRLLYTAVREHKGRSIASYPEYTWHFDTIMALVSLHLWQSPKKPDDIGELLQRHLRWKRQHVTLPSGLPEAHAEASSRGCDITMQICLLQQVDPTYARELYITFIKHHWIDIGLVCGFAEWPADAKGTRAGGDVDSGPIVMGIGSTASGVGLGTTLAVGDSTRHRRMLQALTFSSAMIRGLAKSPDDNEMKRWFSQFAPLDKAYYSGFLYGDAVLFYALTWTPYPAATDK